MAIGESETACMSDGTAMLVPSIKRRSFEAKRLRKTPILLRLARRSCSRGWVAPPREQKALVARLAQLKPVDRFLT